MKTKAVRLYGKDDLRLEEFELPSIKQDEILAKVVSDSICMSTYKAAHQADTHKRVPRDIAEKPVIVGHEFAGEILEVGSKWQGRFKKGDKFSIQPAMFYEGGPVGVLSAPGYSYQYVSTVDSRHAVYRITNPNGVSRLVECNADGVHRHFHRRYHRLCPVPRRPGSGSSSAWYRWR